MRRGQKKARLSLASVYKEKFAAVGNLCRIYLEVNGRSDMKEVFYYRVERLISEISDDDNLFGKFESQINQDLDGILVRMKEDLGIVNKRMNILSVTLLPAWIRRL